MPQGIYLPEGHLLDTFENQEWISSEQRLRRAWQEGQILEGIATMCDDQRNLHVRMGSWKGIIPRKEAGLGADTGKMREIAILSRVGKPVCFRIIGKQGDQWLLSRRSVQEEAARWMQQHLQPGEVIRATVTHLEQFGAFVDIGCGIISMIGIENISVSRIRHAADRFFLGQKILAVVLRKEPGGRICLTHRELLGTWEQNASKLQVGSAVSGIVRGVESYGVFVELFPNLSGLAEPCSDVYPGMQMAVYIKSILPDRMKIKLSLLDRLPEEGKRYIAAEDYYIQEGRLTRWQYQPDSCLRQCVETVFA